MRRVILALISILYLATFSQAQQNSPSEKMAVQNVITEFFDGLSFVDVEKVRSTCLPDLIILESGEIWNFDSLATRISSRKAKSIDFKRVNKLDFLDTKISGDIAWTYYLNQATITNNGKTVDVKWLESAVLKKEKTGWKISLLHSTTIERNTR